MAIIKAPFGFVWGQSQADIKNLDIQLACNQSVGAADTLCTVCKAHQVPKPVSFIQGYRLEFYPGNGLQSVRANVISMAYERLEPHFRSLELSLRGKYGEPGRGRKSAKQGDKDEHIVWRGDHGGLILLSLTSRSSLKFDMNLLYASADLVKLRDENIARKEAAETGAEETDDTKRAADEDAL